MIYKCKYCGKEFDSQQKMAGHIPHCKQNPKYKQNLEQLKKARANIKRNENGQIFVHKGEICECQYCHKQFKLHGLKNHERYCDLNPNKKEHTETFLNTHKHPGGGWNKGLTKETDERLRKQGETYSKRVANGEIIPWFTGKHWSDEEKKRRSEEKIKYYQEHPDRIPYKLYHSSRISYPEQYFKDIFEHENIPLKYHLQVGLYELDFYNEEYKVYVEIDGDTHKHKKVQEIDKRKDDYLKSLGWKGIRICWSEYQKLSREEKELEINKIREFII